MTEERTIRARQVRRDAAHLAHHRTHPDHQANGDEQRFALAHYPMSFTKGLDHSTETGLVDDKADFEAFRQAIDAGEMHAFTTGVPVPKDQPRRLWEAPTAGLAYDLQGPDCQAVTMPPAPALCSDELAFEMAEVYELALVRDVPLSDFNETGTAALNASVARLNGLDYATGKFQGRPRKTDAAGQLTGQTIFRGSAPGVENGPYLSQFMVMGSRDQAGNHAEIDGYINYGALAIDQRVLTATPGKDYMQDWASWHSVQQGHDVNNGGPGQELGARRFICTPRDLATYVHYDALYQAYLNACLLLLGMGAPFDPAFANLSGMRGYYDAATDTKLAPNAGGFALYGGPHILTLVTEVATRALKAVRYQKFNNHLRLRPEALAARVEKAAIIDEKHPSTCGAFGKLRHQICGTVEAIKAFNGDTALLPMAFAEGSPMHPTYGAGHATVAGACVTMLKAFFDTSAVLAHDMTGKVAFRTALTGTTPAHFEVIEKGENLKCIATENGCPLTLEGELNKLAANISIGRNMAGVHYFSDYYDSLRMGEQIALGILEEQALCYPTDEFVMSVPTFDGAVVRIGQR
ncbi:vanadium-dependent haloperoxidase [Yoonia sp. SS1-5]